MKTYIRRGKVDVFITYEDYTMGGMALKYNAELAEEYLGYLNQMSEELGIENDIRVSTLSDIGCVYNGRAGSDEEELWNFLEGPLHEACRKFVETRQREGANLKQDLLGKLDGLEAKVDIVEKRSPEVVRAYREKLEAKMHELLEITRSMIPGSPQR